VHIDNPATVLAFQIHATVRTHVGELIGRVFWNENWIELLPGESRTFAALLPENAAAAPLVQREGWNVSPETITPAAAVAAQ
jgi:hypothetical protein